MSRLQLNCRDLKTEHVNSWRPLLRFITPHLSDMELQGRFEIHMSLFTSHSTTKIRILNDADSPVDV